VGAEGVCQRHSEGKNLPTLETKKTLLLRKARSIKWALKESAKGIPKGRTSDSRDKKNLAGKESKV